MVSDQDDEGYETGLWAGMDSGPKFRMVHMGLWASLEWGMAHAMDQLRPMVGSQWGLNVAPGFKYLLSLKRVSILADFFKYLPSHVFRSR